MDTTFSPAMAGTRNCWRSSLEPKRASAGVAMSVCTAIAMLTPCAPMPPIASQ